MKYRLILNDGTVIENLTQNGNNYISPKYIDESIFVDNLQTLTIEPYIENPEDKIVEVLNEDVIKDKFDDTEISNKETEETTDESISDDIIDDFLESNSDVMFLSDDENSEIIEEDTIVDDNVISDNEVIDKNDEQMSDDTNRNITYDNIIVEDEVINDDIDYSVDDISNYETIIMYDVILIQQVHYDFVDGYWLCFREKTQEEKKDERISNLKKQLEMLDETAIELYEMQMNQKAVNDAHDETLIEIYEMLN